MAVSTADDGLQHVVALMCALVDHGHDTTSRAVRHHLAPGGRHVRARLTLAAAAALRLPTASGVALAAGVELIHNATLVHDDVQDRDRVRRGRPAIWVAFGEDVAICVGDLLLSAAAAAIADAGGDVASLLRLVHRRVADLVHGQVADLASDDTTCLDTYVAIARGKSGALLALPLELPLLRAGRDDQVAVAHAAGTDFAVGYQVADDLGDVERDRLAGAPNIVAVLARGGSRDPVGDAARLAREHLERSSAAARRLPHGAGMPLAVEAERLSGRLSAITAVATPVLR